MVHWQEVNGASIRYELIGSGRSTAVLIHEMGGSLESWDRVISGLALNRRVLRYDWRGCGASSKLRGCADLTVLADDLHFLMEELEIVESAAVIGCAVGGAIALRFSAKYHPAALVAIAPATGVAADRQQATLDRARIAEERGMAEVTDYLLDAGWPQVLRADKATFQDYRARWIANDPYSFAAVYRMLAHLDIQNDFSAIKCPALLVAGRLDQLRPPKAVQEIARLIAGAKFQELESGHFMAIQTPPLLSATIDAFLKLNGL